MKTAIIAFLFATCFIQVFADQSMDRLILSSQMSYEQKRNAYEAYLRQSPSNANRVDAARKVVSASRYGNRGLRRMLGNLDRSSDNEFVVKPGVEKSLLRLNSPSKVQSKGYMRELLYARSLHNDERFSLIGMNQQRKGKFGLTDADVVVRDKSAGIFSRIEVKDVSPESQKTNIIKYKRQIDKMALDGRARGEIQYWVNRRTAIPEIREYAKTKGVVVYDNVKTGRNRNDFSFDRVRDFINRDSASKASVRRLSASTSIVFGALLAKQGISELFDINDVMHTSDLWSADMQLKFGQNLSTLIAGGAMSSSGIANISRSFVEQRYQIGFTGASKALGVGAGLALISQEGFYISRYVRGDVSSREFWTSQWQMAGGAVGSAVGAVGGASIGAVTGNPILSSIGAMAGASIGSFTGGILTNAILNEFYITKFQKLDEEFGEFIYKIYQVQ